MSRASPPRGRHSNNGFGPGAAGPAQQGQKQQRSRSRSPRNRSRSPKHRSDSRSPPRKKKKKDRDRDRSRSGSRSRSRSREKDRRKDKKKSRAGGWDQPPDPNAPKQPDPSVIGAYTTGSGFLAGSTAPSGTMGAHKPQRRLYIGNLPMPITEDEVRNLVNTSMRSGVPHLPPGDLVLSVYLNIEKKFGFVEFRSPEEATAGLAMDGIMYRGQTLKLRRPSDYVPPTTPSPAQPMMNMFSGMAAAAAFGGGFGGFPAGGAISSQVPDGPNKVFCGGLPYNLSENEIRELVASFGQLRAFHLVRERDSNTSKGFCFFEFADPSITDVAIAGLNNIKLGDKTLTVRRAQSRAVMAPGVSQALNNAAAAGVTNVPTQMLPVLAGGMGVPGLPPPNIPMGGPLPGMQGMGGMPMLMGGSRQGQIPSRILVLREMVTGDELINEQDYREIYEDIELECGKYGHVKSLVIPRPGPQGQHMPGVGKVTSHRKDDGAWGG